MGSCQPRVGAHWGGCRTRKGPGSGESTHVWPRPGPIGATAPLVRAAPSPARPVHAPTGPRMSAVLDPGEESPGKPARCGSRCPSTSILPSARSLRAPPVRRIERPGDALRIYRRADVPAATSPGWSPQWRCAASSVPPAARDKDGSHRRDHPELPAGRLSAGQRRVAGGLDDRRPQHRLDLVPDTGAWTALWGGLSSGKLGLHRPSPSGG